MGRSEAPPWARHYQTQAQIHCPPDPKLPKHHTIPPYIFRPGMEGPVQNQFVMEAIRDLERRIMQEPNQAHTAESLTTLYWAWWRSLTPERKKPQADIPALVQSCLKQKGTHVILRPPTHDALIKAIGTAIDSRPTPNGAREVARTELYKALELLDAQAITYRLAPKTHPKSLATEATQQRSGTGCENSKPPRAPITGPSTEPTDTSATQYKTWIRQ